MEQHSPAGVNPELLHESAEYSERVVVGFSIGLLVFLGLSALLMVLLMRFLPVLYPVGPLSPFADRDTFPPQPRLQVSPHADLLRLNGREDRILNSYAWIDRSTGRVRIPIDRAIDIIAERGLPARNEKAVPKPTGKGTPTLPPPVYGSWAGDENANQ